MFLEFQNISHFSHASSIQTKLYAVPLTHSSVTLYFKVSLLQCNYTFN